MCDSHDFLAELNGEIADMRRCYPQWRLGQCAFNALMDLRPDVADAIRATEDDPFYDDERIPRFLKKVKEILTPD